MAAGAPSATGARWKCLPQKNPARSQQASSASKRPARAASVGRGDGVNRRNRPRAARPIRYRGTPARYATSARLFAIHHAERDATPEAPAAEVALGQAFGGDVMVDDEARHVTAARAQRQQPMVHVLVLAPEQPCAGAVERGRIRPCSLEHAPAEDRVAAHQDAGIARHPSAAIPAPGSTQPITPRYPSPSQRGRGAAQRGKHLPPMKSSDSSAERFGDAVEPRRVHLLVVVDQPDQVAVGRGEPGVQRVRLARCCFEQVLNRPSNRAACPATSSRVPSVEPLSTTRTRTSSAAGRRAAGGCRGCGAAAPRG